MSILQLRALHAIGRYKSFALAAGALNVTQSAISMQISGLERSLGAKLFDRSKRPPRLTAAGEIALRYASSIVAEFEEMRIALGETHGFRNVLRLGAIPSVLTNILPRVLVALREDCPELTVNVASGLSGDLMAMVERGELDLALMHQPRKLGRVFAWHEVSSQKIVVLAPPQSKEATAEAIFSVRPYIRFNRNAWVAPMIEERLAELGLKPDTRAELQSIEAIHLMVQLGFGASVLPDVGDAGHSNSRLRKLEFGSPPIFRSIGLLYRPDATKKFVHQSVLGALNRLAIARN
ncbi:MAG: LysR family transcriptional regulator [Albidovulum sp.]|nr:LysR family transcriptional regulator [Albidovulum sp.]MDE0306979.1 LysR family transcriptional regulator [Albidovulum sp.]MDE0530851.1 LysR family transcriptional regulator [Albidovulum sp.]